MKTLRNGTFRVKDSGVHINSAARDGSGSGTSGPRGSPGYRRARALQVRSADGARHRQERCVCAAAVGSAEFAACASRGACIDGPTPGLYMY
eukprot:657280-Prymnesium_polylepis.1